MLSVSIIEFQNIVYSHYRSRDLPWRKTRDPYAILVSEVMLQQTQVERVVPKYETWLAAFPDFSSLARARLARILRAWQGLGYNRRALYLKETACRVLAHHRGVLPTDPRVLQTFPGIGTATAAGIAAFAFNKPTVFIETNIRAAFIHHFFKDRADIRDADILPLVSSALDTNNPRRWYSALMDYGAMIKKTHPNPNRRSAHYSRQTPFRGSNREVRGMIIKALLTDRSLTPIALARKLQKNVKDIQHNLDCLRTEGFEF